MPIPTEHKTVQARILAYAQEIGWTYVPRDEAERRRGFTPHPSPLPEGDGMKGGKREKAEDARKASLFFGDLLHTKVRAFNPKYKEAEGALVGDFQRFHADIYGNRDFLTYLRNQGKFFCAEESRELDLTLIDYGDLARPCEQWRNVYEVTEEFYTHNGKYGTREDVVFLINGIPVLVIECKNASKDEAIALGVDQICRYHAETPEVMVPEMIFTATEAIGFAYGVTWNTVRRNIFNWKHEETGNLEAKVKSFCAVPHLLRVLKDFILFAEKEEELQKIILHQHQTKVARYVADHYMDNVEPLGYKAFLVAVDREACALYKEALDAILLPEYSEVVYTGNNNDPAHMKKWHIGKKKEKQIRKNFAKFGEWPKILIVTEKLLTGFDAPILYAMYLDKPMRDHTLLQAIARVNRPYENEATEMVKRHGFVLDFVGIFDKLEKALAFDSDEINAIVKDICLLKHLFKAKMETKAPAYLGLVTSKFDDKDVDNLIEHFRDKERRKEFFKEYKEIEMLYEIISPDAFLRPFIEPYTTLSSIYAVVRNAYARKVYVDRAFQKKTNELVQKHIGAMMTAETPVGYVGIDAEAIELIKKQKAGDGTKVINLVKSIEKTAEENSDDPFLVAMAERAKAVQESFEDRQTSTGNALADLLAEIERNEQRKKEQAARGLDGLTYFVLCKLRDEGVANAEAVSRKVREAFAEFPNWRRSEKELRELRKKVTFAVFAEEDDMDKVTTLVDSVFAVLQKTGSA